MSVRVPAHLHTRLLSQNAREVYINFMNFALLTLELCVYLT